MGEKKIRGLFKKGVTGVVTATMIATTAVPYANVLADVMPESAVKSIDKYGLRLSLISRKNTGVEFAADGSSKITIGNPYMSESAAGVKKDQKGVVYVAAYPQINPDTSFEFVTGAVFKMHLSRPIKLARDLEEDPDETTEEYFDFVSGSFDVDADGIIETNTSGLLDPNPDPDPNDDNNRTEFAGTAAGFYQTVTAEDLKQAYTARKKNGKSDTKAYFVLAFHNLTEDVEVSYEPEGAIEYTDVDPFHSGIINYVAFDDDKIDRSDTKGALEFRKYVVQYDTEIGKSKLSINNNFNVKPIENEVVTEEKVAKLAIPKVLAPEKTAEITTENSGYEFEGWYTDPELTQKFDFTTELRNEDGSVKTDLLKPVEYDTNNDKKNDEVYYTLKLYAKYRPAANASYRIRYVEKQSDGSYRDLIDQKSVAGVTYGSTIPAADMVAPEIPGYAFKSTTSDTNTGGKFDVVDDVNKIVYMLYEAKEGQTAYKIYIHEQKLDDANQTVSYDLEDATLNKEFTVLGGTAGRDLALTKDLVEADANIDIKNYIVGFTFDGISKTATGSKSQAVTQEINGDGSTEYHVFYKRNKYTVNFNTSKNKPTDEAVASGVPSQALYYGSTLTGNKKPEDPTLANADGYKFSQWEDEKGDGIDLEQYTVPAKDDTLYADYAAKTDIKYTVHFYNINNKDKKKTDDMRIKEDVIVDNKTFGAKETYKVPTDIIGYTAADAFVSAFDEDGNSIAFGSGNLTFELNKATGKEITIYYQGDKTYNGEDITYSIELYTQKIDKSGYELSDTKKVKDVRVGDTITLDEKTVPTVAKFTFDATNALNVLTGVVPTPDKPALVLKAYYNRNSFQIEFDPAEDLPEGIDEDDIKGFDPTKAQQEVCYGDKAEDPGDPEIPGYDFDGWTYTDDNGKHPFDPAIDTMPGEDITLVPTWVEKTDVVYTVKTYYMNTDGKYTTDEFDSAKYTGCKVETKTGKTGTAIEADKTAPEGFKYSANPTTEQGKKENVNEKGTITPKGDTVLVTYMERNKVKLNFDTTSSTSLRRDPSQPASDKNPVAVLDKVPSTEVYYGSVIPTDKLPEIVLKPTEGGKTKDPDGWYTADQNDAAYNPNTPIKADTTLIARVKDKSINVKFDKSDKFDDVMYRLYIRAIAPGNLYDFSKVVADKHQRGDQLNFILNVNGQELKSSLYDTYTAEQKAMLDSVKFNSTLDMMPNTFNAKRTNNNGESFRVADIVGGTGENDLAVDSKSRAGQAIARFTGVQKVTLEYAGISSDTADNGEESTAAIGVPGDVNRSGTYTISDISIMAELLRGRIVGDPDIYMKDLTDMNGSKTVTISDLSIAAELLRGQLEYSNTFI